MTASSTALMVEVQQATRAIRERLNDESYSVSVKAGRFRFCRVTYLKDGRGDVTPLSGWLTLADLLSLMATYSTGGTK